MVELEPVADSRRQAIVARYDYGTFHVHRQPQGEARAGFWDATVPKFVKVMPVDYKRVLEERKRKASAVH